ncbi:hypothetical protein Q6A91_08615 [Aliarcobacter skirrowii]|uniref:hypothetical protein n=1 Tax=Aliarcobacter skirrowii TaxID=28200 RepID=UPI0029B947B3|nr:hypothetical protein [Aliarcobacter skirrowii]MDX4066079.1 hypothetical protein [Aliarcobacter skirrowii]
MKEFIFITTVKIAKNVAELYPNYKINCFTPKSLAKRFASGNSEKNSLKDFGFEYKTKELKNVGMGLLQDEKERKRVKKILDDLNKKH